MEKILITSRSFGQISGEPLDLLKSGGYEVEFYNDSYDEEVFAEKLKTSDGLIIGAHELKESAIRNASRLKCVIKHGTGLDNIDLNITKKYGIHVDNVPAANAEAVADLAFSLILDVARRTSFAVSRVRDLKWEKIIGRDVFGKTLSLIGFGTIGRNVARRARGFAMNVLVYDPMVETIPEEFNDFVRLTDFASAVTEADFLSLHLPLNEDTRYLIGAEEFGMMKKGSYIINTSRGGIVDETALAEWIRNGHLGGAALDAIENEPIRSDNALTGLDNVVITPHIGMYSEEAINMVSIVAARKIVEFFERQRETTAHRHGARSKRSY